MSGTFPRRQAARLCALFSRNFVSGLTCLAAPPRRGKSDLLRQLFDGLLKQRAVAPVLLEMGHARLPDGAAELAAAQIAAFHQGRLLSPHAVLDRERLAERDDVSAWMEFLCAGAAPDRFFPALARLSETAGPVCLLLDDAPENCLHAAAAAAAPGAAGALAVAAAAGPLITGSSFGAAQVLPLEELSVREGVLLAEGLARSLGVEFSGAAAEPFVAYTGSDPFVLQAAVRRAATGADRLMAAADWVRAYIAELTDGTLAAWFHSRAPGAPGSPERLFALEVLSTGEALEAGRLKLWRHRLDLDDALERMRRGGWLIGRSAGWQARPWTAARDWAVLETAAVAGQAVGPLTLRLLSDLEQASRAHGDEQLASRIASGLGALTPAAGEWLAENGVAGAKAPAVCHVTRQPIPGGDLYLCYGFAEGRRRPESQAVLAVALAGSPRESTRLAQILEEMNRRAAEAKGSATRSECSALPAAECALEKWLVLKDPGLAELEMAERAGARLVELDLFNRLISTAPAGADAEPPPCDVALKLPMNADYEIAAVRVLDHLLERANCDKRVASQARIALVEACLNAIEHGRAARLDPAVAQMEIRIAVTGEALEMVVTNPGPPFQPEVRDEAAGDPERTLRVAGGAALGSSLHRGHGLKIIRSLMDRVSFSSDLNGTSIRMFKRLAPAAPPGSDKEPVENEKTATAIKRN